MSEFDYQRGLRGGDCQNYDGQAYRDWLTGNKEYEINNGTYSGPTSSDYERWKKEDKKRAYKNADNMLSTGILLSLLWFVVVLIAGYIIQWFLDLFKVHLPSIVIWIIAILLMMVAIWESNTSYKKDKEEACRKYGDED